MFRPEVINYLPEKVERNCWNRISVSMYGSDDWASTGGTLVRYLSCGLGFDRGRRASSRLAG